MLKIDMDKPRETEEIILYEEDDIIVYEPKMEYKPQPIFLVDQSVRYYYPKDPNLELTKKNEEKKWKISMVDLGIGFVLLILELVFSLILI